MTAAPKTRIYLENRPTITRIVPELAVAIGLNESILLLQIDFWIGQSTNFEDGRYWTYQSLRDMQEKAFAYMGLATINRAVQSLEEQKLITVGNYNKRKGDNTRWFALNPEGLRKLAERVPCIIIADSPIQNETAPPPQAGKESQNGSPTDQNGSTLPETTTESQDQKKKEVLVARDVFFHPVFLEVINDPTPRPITAELTTPASSVPDDADFLIELFADYFGDRFVPTRKQVLAAIAQYTFVEVRQGIEEARSTNKSGVVQWGYVEAILERRYQQKLDDQTTSTPHDRLLGLRFGYQPQSPADDMIHQHALWQAYRSKWRECTGEDIPVPPLKVKQYADTARFLDSLRVTPDEIGRLVEKKWQARKTGYSFLYTPEHIGELRAEDALRNRERDPELIAAVGKVWKSAPGDYVNEIADLLTTLDRPMLASEVTKFGAWYAAQPQFKSQAKPPSSADSLIRRVNEFRAQRQPSAANANTEHPVISPPRIALTANQIAERDRIKRDMLRQPEGEL